MLPPGMSDLEFRRVVQYAFLPDTCDIQAVDDHLVTLKVTSHRDPTKVVVQQNVPKERLNSIRSIACVVRETRAAFKNAWDRDT